MCLISTRLCKPDLITWNIINPGRLVHIRLHGSDKSIDIIHVYQHVHSSDRMDDRLTIWTQLNDLLTTLPKRYYLIMMGDFNTTLPHRSSVVGVGTFLRDRRRITGTMHSDSDIFHQLLRQHSLQALNTWSHSLGPTYRHGGVNSRIDYICCRRQHSDATAQDIQYMESFPLCQGTSSYHVPLLASLLRH